VIHDLLKNLDKRGMRIDFLHSAVDGEGAAPDLVAAIEYFSYAKERPQILVVIRGGGSLESLQAFNNERVCRAFFSCPIPVVAGIGHDVDIPLATLVADASPSTPTAVAHLINQTWADTLIQIPTHERSILLHMERRIESVAHTISTATRDIDQYFSGMLADLRWKIKNFEQILALADPARVLKRGYSIVYATDGSVVRSVAALKKGDRITTNLADGMFAAQIDSITTIKK
jgi:exodeoxyribonuclease VII large subunit